MVDSERGAIRRAPKVGVAIATSTMEAACSPTLTPSSSHFTCGSTTSCWGFRLAPAPGDRRRSPIASSSRSRSRRCSWAFPTIGGSSRSLATGSGICSRTGPSSPPTTSACALGPRIAQVITHLAVDSPSFGDGLRLLDSTPVPCGQSRETARRSELAGYAAYGYCRSHSRYFWGFRLYLLCAPDGMPIAFELAAANAPERQVAAEMLERVSLEGYTVIADKGFAGDEFEAHMAGVGARFLRPDRRDEDRRHGSLGPVRQWIESVFWTCKGQLTLERHGGRTITGVCVRVALRLLALAAGLIHNHDIGDPGRHFAAYGH